MANGNDMTTKADLEECLDRVQSILEDAYQPESDRETLAAAIGDALDAIEGGPTDENDDYEDDDDDARRAS